MKILFLSDDFPPKSYGGAGIVAFELARQMLREGHEVFAITVVNDKKDEGYIEYEGLKMHRLHSGYKERWRAYLSLYNPRVIKKVEKIMNGLKPDVVHAHNIHYHLSYHSLKLARTSGAKVFLTAHDAMLFHYGKFDGRSGKVSVWLQIRKFRMRYNPFRNLVIRHYLKYTNKIFSVSRALKDTLNKNGVSNVVVVHNGIDLNKWQSDLPATERFKERHDLVGKKVILFGGRLSVAKGGRQALLVMAEVAKKMPGAVLLIMGPKNEYADEMARQARDLNISENVVFTGWITGVELKAAYSASDVVAVLSLYLDPLPTVVLEAMASGKPVVGTCFGGTNEMVVDKVTGFLINPFKTEEVAARILELLDDNPMAQGFGKAGQSRAETEFTLAAQAREVLRYYQEETDRTNKYPIGSRKT